MEPQMILTIVLAVIACVVVGIVYYRLVTKERSGQQHAGAVNAAPGDDTPYSDRGANGAFLRRLRTAAARRDVAMLVTDPAKTPFAALIVGPHGVTAVYAVDYDGTIYGGSDEEWVQMKDGVRRTFENPPARRRDGPPRPAGDHQPGQFPPVYDRRPRGDDRP